MFDFKVIEYFNINSQTHLIHSSSRSIYHSLKIKTISLFVISSPHLSAWVFPNTHLPLTYRKSLDIPPTSLIPGHPLCN